jgi:hypothetical protein
MRGSLVLVTIYMNRGVGSALFPDLIGIPLLIQQHILKQEN